MQEDKKEFIEKLHDHHGLTFRSFVVDDENETRRSVLICSHVACDNCALNEECQSRDAETGGWTYVNSKEIKELKESNPEYFI